MATTPDDLPVSESLARARANASLTRDRMEHIQQNGIQNMPSGLRSRPAQGGPLTDAAAKTLKGRESDFREVEGDGDALGLRYFKVKAQPKKKPSADEKKGRADIKPSSLHRPSTRSKRLSTDDGRTSFHFSHEAISKQRGVTIDADGRVTRPGQAKDHQRYIERAGAVAREDMQREPETRDADALALDAALGLQPDDVDPRTQKKGVIHDSAEEKLRLARRFDATVAAYESGFDGSEQRRPAEPLARMRGLSGIDLVHDHPEARMFLSSVPLDLVEGGRGSGDGMRPEGDRNREDGGRGERVEPQGRAAEQTGYIERQEALARQPDGSLVLFTNIDDDPNERTRFWDLVEKFEREPDRDRITFTIASHPEFWADLVAQPECPPELVQAYQTADHAKPVSLRMESNEQLREFLKGRPGYVGPMKREEGEDKDAYGLRRKGETITYHDARGGRIQYRLIGELPHDLDLAARSSILRQFCSEFEERKLPYVAVMHAPDHTNDDRNWHFHIIYHDRPVSRLTAADVQAYADTRQQQSVMPNDRTVGAWDFTIEEQYQTSSREWRQRFPFRQNKVEEVAQDKGWITKLRKKLASITNDHLEAAGIDRRIDARKHSEMGIHADPQEHLGSKMATLEALGIETPVGTSNEEKQWNAVLTRMEGKLHREWAAVDREQRQYERNLARLKPDDVQRRKLEMQIARYVQNQREAVEQGVIADYVTEHMERLLSRSNKTITTAVKHLDAINSGKASKWLARRKGDYHARLTVAQAFVGEASSVLKMEQEFVTESREQQKQCAAMATLMKAQIEETFLALSDGKLRGPEKEKAAGEVKRPPVDKTSFVSKAIQDEWINAILRDRRRMVTRNGRVEPRKLVDADQAIIASGNYHTMKRRLEGIKKSQDAAIAELVSAIQQYPYLLKELPAENGGTRFEFNHPRPLTKETFKAFHAEEDVVAAVRKAVADSAQNGAQKAQESVSGPSTPPATSAVPERAPRAPAGINEAESSNDNVADRRRRDRNADLLAEQGLRVKIVGGRFQFGALAQAALDLDPSDAGDDAFMRRVRGIIPLQDRELKRLSAYARSHPDKLRLDAETGIVSLSPKAPRELVDLDKKWRAEPEHQQMLVSTRAAYRDEISKKAADAAIADTPVDGAPRPTDDARSQRPAGETPVDNPTAKTPALSEADRRKQEDEQRERAKQERLARLRGPIRSDFDAAASERAREEALRREAERQANTPRRIDLTPDQIAAMDSAGMRDAVDRANAQRGPGRDAQGAHPLIDRWLEALAIRLDVNERRARAAQVMNDREAARILAEIDRETAQRIRDDAERRAEQMRDQGRSNERDNDRRR